MPMQNDAAIAAIEVSAYRWVPPFAQGHVRDLRVRWALEEIGLPYRVKLIDVMAERPADYLREQPFGQVPAYHDDDAHIFESGAIVIHIGEKDERLLPRDPQGRARAIGWLIAALNTLEPQTGQLAVIDIFCAGQAWTAERRPAVVEMIEKRLGQIAAWLGDREWLEDRFTIGDLMMVAALRDVEPALLAGFPTLAAYVARGTARPAFRQALADQMACFEQQTQGEMA